MKKILISVLVLAILAVAALFFWEGQRPKKIEEILPAGPIYFVRSKDLAKQLDQLTATRAWQELKQIQARELLSKLGIAEQDLQAFDHVKTEFGSYAARATFKKLFGQEVGVAIYPPQIAEWNNEAIKKIASSVFLVARPSPEVRVAEVFPKLFEGIHKSITITVTEYKRHRIYLVSTRDGVLTIGYTRIGDLVVFGAGDEAARNCIDVVTRSQAPLSRDIRWVKAQAEFMPDANTEGFLNWALLFDGLKAQVTEYAQKQGEDKEAVRKKIEESLDLAGAFTQVGFSGKVAPTSRFRVTFSFERDKLPEETRAIYACPAQENKTLSLIPQDILGYQWSPCYDFARYWQASKKEMAQALSRAKSETSPEDVIAGLEQSLGVSMEGEVLPALGGEFGGALVDFGMHDTVPQVEFLLFVETPDAAKAEKVITTLVSRQSAFILQSEDYSGHTIHFLNAPVFLDFRPGYLLLKGYLFLGTDPAVLKKVIDTANVPSKGLGEAAFLKPAGVQPAEKNNSFFFLRLGPLAEKAGDVVAWGNQWLTEQDVKREAVIAGVQKHLEDVKQKKEQLKTTLAQAQIERSQAQDTLQGLAPVSPLEQANRQKELEDFNVALSNQIKQIDDAVAGAQDTAALLEEKRQLEQKIIQKQTELKEVVDRSASLTVGQAQLTAASERVEALQKEIADLEAEQEKGVFELTQYARQQPMPTDLRTFLIEGGLTPVLRGLSACPIFVLKTLFRSEAVDIDTFLRME